MFTLIDSAVKQSELGLNPSDRWSINKDSSSRFK